MVIDLYCVTKLSQPSASSVQKLLLDLYAGVGVPQVSKQKGKAYSFHDVVKFAKECLDKELRDIRRSGKGVKIGTVAIEATISQAVLDFFEVDKRLAERLLQKVARTNLEVVIDNLTIARAIKREISNYLLKNDFKEIDYKPPRTTNSYLMTPKKSNRSLVVRFDGKESDPNDATIMENRFAVVNEVTAIDDPWNVYQSASIEVNPERDKNNINNILRQINTFVLNNTPDPKPTLKAPVRNKLNKAIYQVLKPTYFRTIPLQDIQETLAKFDIVIVDEDGSPWSGLFTGTQGRTSIDLAPKDTEHMRGGGVAYFPFTNAALHLSWYKMESGRYEIVGYIS